MQKYSNNLLPVFPKLSREGLQKKIKAFYELLTTIYGADKLILKATKFEALKLIQSPRLEEKVLGLQKIVFEDPTLDQIPPFKKVPAVLDELEEQAAEIMARRLLKESLEKRVNLKLQERHEDYIREVKEQLLKEEAGPENSRTLKKYALLEKMFAEELSHSALEFLRPASLKEIVGQERGIRALMSKLASPFPQHLIIYGPPGVGKTAAARLALETAKKTAHAPFSSAAPFVEVDAATLRWDPRETANPLLGSVHDPIYQGARRELGEGGIPEPKPGLVSEAHGGVLFIDEIGEMDLRLQNKLLKVLEDKRVYFDSAYYDPAASQVPKYIHKLFAEGAPADFVLVGATTKASAEISPALKSRCSAVYFEPLSPEDIQKIVKNAAKRLAVKISPAAVELISRYTSEGRSAIKLLADAYGLALYSLSETKSGGNGFLAGTGKNGLQASAHKNRPGKPQQVVLGKEIMEEVIQSNRLLPLVWQRHTAEAQIGKIYGLAAAGYLGTVLEIEAISFKASQPGKGKIRFNEAAGVMARDSVFNAASVLRKVCGLDISEYDLHINVIGGANIEGPSAGAALFLALYSALKQVPLRQDVAVSGELSLQGKIKSVGGLSEKLYGARIAGVREVFLPQENYNELFFSLQGIKINYVAGVEDLLPLVLVQEAEEK
ncbi:MAG: sigma 54-interacting transcriptional regulator [Firmicutes bacterium]|nr:sigma 54-interacting transcriptional regulator [Bacillota bacterium]